MKVRAVYQPGSAYVTRGDSLRAAARKMRSSGQGCLPVLAGASVAGIVTERDLANAVANGVPPSEGFVNEYTSDGSATVSLDDDCDVAELKMLVIGCRNLPVVDQDKLVGTISMRDVVLKVHANRALPRPAGKADVIQPSRDSWPDEPPPDVDSEP